MVDPVAIWGALTGSVGLALAARREYLSRRTQLAIRPGVNLNVSRVDPVGEITHAWAFVNFWNTGGRPIAVEHVGFRYYVGEQIDDGGTVGVWEYRAEITLPQPIGLAVDGPSQKVHTPLGPLLAAGVKPTEPIEAFAITTGDREWFSPPQPLMQSIPFPTTVDDLGRDLMKLKDESEIPPRFAETRLALKQEEPFLPAG